MQWKLNEPAPVPKAHVDSRALFRHKNYSDNKVQNGHCTNLVTKSGVKAKMS